MSFICVYLYKFQFYFTNYIYICLYILTIFHLSNSIGILYISLFLSHLNKYENIITENYNVTHTRI